MVRPAAPGDLPRSARDPMYCPPSRGAGGARTSAGGAAYFDFGAAGFAAGSTESASASV